MKQKYTNQKGKIVPLWLAVSLLALSALTCHAQSGALNIYNWSDYIGETTNADFEKESGIKVRYDIFDSNELLHAKMVAGQTGYDIVFPSIGWAKLQMDAGLLKKIDKSKIPNYKNLDPWVLAQLATVDPGNQYLLPYMWGITTVGINTDKVKKALADLPMPDDAWDLLFNPKYISRLKSCGVSMLDTGDEVIPAALRYLRRDPMSRNAADYRDVHTLLKTVRPYVTLFSSAGYINDLAGGALCASLGWNGDIGIATLRAKEAKNGQNLEILIPKSGAILYFDGMSIPADAKNVDNAYKWIDFMCRTDTQVGIVNKISYANAVRASDPLIKPEVRANHGVFLKSDDLTKMVPLSALTNDVRRLRTKTYTAFKSGIE